VIERVLVLRRDGGNWEVRFRREAWWRRWLRAWREERAALKLAELDERTLKDIGLDACGCNPLGRRIHVYREQESRRSAMARLGLM
jgi:hypothetical protein